MAYYTPMRTDQHGRMYLSQEVLRLDDHHRVYRRRRQQLPLSYRAADLFFRLGVPLLALLLAALCWVGLFYLVVGIGHAIRSVTGG